MTFNEPQEPCVLKCFCTDVTTMTVMLNLSVFYFLNLRNRINFFFQTDAHLSNNNGRGVFIWEGGGRGRNRAMDPPRT